MSSNKRDDGIQGEGDYEAARRYDQRTREFVESGKVEPAARAAKPGNAAEEEEMTRAEEEGRAHSKGEDPLLSKGTAQKKP